ncbi:GDYXXLXY domain-containing protein [Novosphingobium sp.]|uniref:GDYXXLXY domain-containing protein n=1 Tax=Novosphingobium sp. TaxID=1874826 RepID=UPI0027377296|nr:GDYXXLXY domain-containing protein [Novosphingobium sp.]MDP3908448.1 GDYXXLXY domain-containing protein [Novosphingobium sp.]
MTRTGLLRSLLLALPLAGLAGLWGWSDHQSRQGTDWDIPVQGYDPRDLLRGHYVQFRYDWPGIETVADEDPMAWNGGRGVCLEGRAPVLTRASIYPPPVEAAALPSDLPLPECPQLARAEAPLPGQPTGTEGGRLYIPQAAADRLNAQLADPKLQGIVRVRLRPDGHLTPLGLTFRPRPVQPAE